MTYPLSETFDDAQGRWNGFASFDATEAYDSLKGFLSTQRHVDLRVFRTLADILPAPQNPDLDTVTQATLEADVQSAMETDPGALIKDEKWALSANAVAFGVTASGNEITDAVRSTATQGDGRGVDSSFGIYEATTNRVTNGGFETDASGWTTGGTNTIAASTDQAKFGTKSGKATYQNNTLLADYAITLPFTVSDYTASVWAYIPAAYTGTKLQVSLLNFVGATASFPTVPVLDDFNRAGTTSPPSANWSALGISANQLRLTGDSATVEGQPSAAAFDYWNPGTFGPDTDVYVTLAGNTRSGGDEGLDLYARVTNPGNATTCNGYQLTWWNDGTLALYQFTGATATLIHSFSSLALAVGDSLGMRVKGTGATVTIEVYKKAAAGAWTLFSSYADTSGGRITGAGYIGLGVGNTTVDGFKADNFGGGTVVPSGNLDMTKRDQWQRLKIPFTTAGDAVGDLAITEVGTAPGAGQSIYLDGVQIEALGWATPYVHTNGATATRAAGSISVPTVGLSATQGFIATRVRMNHPSSWVPTATYASVFQWGSGADYYHLFWQSGSWQIGHHSSGGAAFLPVTSSFADGDLFTLVAWWDATKVYLSVNGSAPVSLTKTGAPSISNTSFLLGTDYNPAPLDGDVLWCLTGSGTPDYAALNALGNTDPTLAASGSPLVAWSADTTSASSSGGFGLTSLTVGKIASRGGWSGAQMTTSGDPFTHDLTSSITDVIDISAMDNLVTILPDYNSLDGTSYVQLTSAADGTFGTAALNSAQVAFSANGSIMPELRLAISAFASGAGASFSLAKVTGVKVHLVRAVAPAANQTVTLMAMRAIKTGWTESALDFDTRIGAICVPVTLTGSAYGGTVAQNFQFVRGDGTKEDPIPMNVAMNMYFSPGGGTSPNDATGANYNKIGFIVRELKSTSAGTGSHIQARLKFNDTATTFEAVRVDTTGGSPGTETDTALHTISVGGPLDPAKRYLFRVEIRGTQIDAQIYETDSKHSVGALTWQLPTTITDSQYVQRNGRVGFIASLLSRDAFIDGVDVSPTGYAELKTKRYTSRSPIDGAQLAAVFAPDINLWSSFTGADLVIDQTKTTSGTGSYRSALGLTTNSFIVDDWTETYLKLAVWVPSGVTLKNQPQILLNTQTGQNLLPMPKLQPSQWNDLYFDLGIFRNLISASAYSFSILPATNPDSPLGFFWVDSAMVGRRRVAWFARATTNGLFRDFKSLVNSPTGAVHFPANERGTSLQVKAVALTEDAWVSSFKIFPRYAELGLPVYDQGFSTR